MLNYIGSRLVAINCACKVDHKKGEYRYCDSCRKTTYHHRRIDSLVCPCGRTKSPVSRKKKG